MRGCDNGGTRMRAPAPSERRVQVLATGTRGELLGAIGSASARHHPFRLEREETP